MMGNWALMTVGTASIGFAGTYLYFGGRNLAERALDRVLEFQKRLRGGYYRKIDPNATCPSCGAKNGKISFNPIIQKVVHTCIVDGAQWAENPRIPAQAWDFVGRDVKQAGDKKSDLLEIMDRANAVTLRKAATNEEKAN